MSAFALIQINFVSFAAPLATLSIMDKRGVSDRQMAATLAMVFAMGQGNVFYPLTPFGLHWLASIVISVVGGLCAAAVAARHRTALIGRRAPRGSAAERRAEQRGILAVINSAGSDAIRGARRGANADPVVNHRRAAAGRRGYRPAAAAAEAASQLAAHPAELCSAGAGEVRCRGTAYFGVISELIQQGKVTVDRSTPRQVY